MIVIKPNTYVFNIFSYYCYLKQLSTRKSNFKVRQKINLVFSHDARRTPKKKTQRIESFLIPYLIVKTVIRGIFFYGEISEH